MYSLNTMQTGQGARKRSKRVGRGQGSGNGTTAGYGNNGAKARSGYKHKEYFEGGQTPLTRRIPKKGFKPRSRNEYQTVNLAAIEKKKPDVKEIDVEWLFENKLIRSKDKPVKVLGNGSLPGGITIKADAYSASARRKLKLETH